MSQNDTGTDDLEPDEQLLGSASASLINEASSRGNGGGPVTLGQPTESDPQDEDDWHNSSIGLGIDMDRLLIPSEGPQGAFFDGQPSEAASSNRRDQNSTHTPASNDVSKVQPVGIHLPWAGAPTETSEGNEMLSLGPRAQGATEPSIDQGWLDWFITCEDDDFSVDRSLGPCSKCPESP